MDQVIIYNKTMQIRSEEYSEVFSNYKTVPASEIKKAWSNYLQEALDPNGWQAIWKVPRLTCESLEISFPTVVLVYVELVGYAHLTACVKILAVQDDIHLPEDHVVKLIHLWPTKDQDPSVGLNLDTTANSVDMLRFFYNNLFMPWDYDDDDSNDWVTKHLNYRLRLYYDMTCGSTSRAVAEYFSSLLTEARRLQSKREHVEMKLHDKDLTENDESSDNKYIRALAEINVQLLQIRSQMDMLENPLMRDVVLNQQEIGKTYNKGGAIWVVTSNEGNIDDYLNFFEKIRLQYPSQTIVIRRDVTDVLEERDCDDIIILHKTQHVINHKSLITGCVLKGIYGKEDTILTSSNENIMLDLGGEVFVENLTIEAANAQCGICVRSGRVTLKNCKIIGDGRSTIHQGIIVLGGTHLELINCEITGFYVAIIGNSGSTIILNGCDIYNVNCGLKIFENCTLDAGTSTLKNCREYGIIVETNNNSEGSPKRIGNFDILSIIPRLQIRDLCGANNLKGNVLINTRKKIEPFFDLFNSPKSSVKMENANNDEDDEMGSFSEDGLEFNNTVIERSISPYTI